MAHTGDGVRIDTVDGVLRIRWDRADRYNSLDPAMVQAAVDALERAAGDPSVRLVTVTGEGTAFCAGASLRDRDDREGAQGAQSTKGTGDDENAGDDLPDVTLLDALNRWALACRAAPQLVVALVNGVAAGVGTSIVLGSDLVLMSSGAYLKNAFEAIGLAPDGGGTAFLPANLGRSKAMAVAVLGDRLDAEECLRLGLAARVHDAESFAGESAALVDRLANGPTRSYAAIKQAIDARTLADLPAAVETERHLQRRLLASRDFAEGVEAFLEKRQPEFTGE